MKPHILVVAGALFDREGLVLIAERPPGKHMAGRWEFPGGKVGSGESEAAALTRELREELGIEVIASRHLMRLSHSYDDRSVELSMWIVDSFSGTPQSLDGQRFKWVHVGRLEHEDILEADRPFVTALGSLSDLGSSAAGRPRDDAPKSDRLLTCTMQGKPTDSLD